MESKGTVQAHVVLGLGFGDCGKGLLTDHLVRRTGAQVVVRFNGGAQAAHNVVEPGGLHHTFAQFGAGTFAGARTFLSRFVVVHPTALLVEGRLLEGKGLPDVFARIRVSENAPIITPYHQALNRLRELARGPARHGSCGVGIGETVSHSLDHPEEVVRARDLGDAAGLRHKLGIIRERLRTHVDELSVSLPASAAADSERSIFERGYVAGRWIEAVSELPRRDIVVPDATLGRWLDRARSVVFEGAQGVLLDEDRGFHPHTTWSRCTFANAVTVLEECAPHARMTRVGVLRSHAVRHGDGPLPSHSASLRPAITEHNRSNDWQGDVRYGWFDAVLARHALEIVGGVDQLAITHMDLVGRLEQSDICVGYTGAELEGPMDRLPVTDVTSLAVQEQMGRLLKRVQPVLRTETTEAGFLARVEGLLERPVDLISRGPRSSDVAIRSRDSRQ